MKRIQKLILPILLLLVVLTGCNTTETKEAKMYGVINELTYYEGSYYDPLDSITAFDEAGADVTNKIQVVGNLPIVDGILTTPGVYEYELVVIINDKEILSEQVILTVLEAPEVIIDTVKPNINGNGTYVLMVGDELKINVTATDNIDGDITNKLEIDGLNKIPVDSKNCVTTAGTYYLTYSVKDNALNAASKNVILVVKEPAVFGDIIRNDIISEEYKTVNETVKLENYKLVWADEFNYTGAPDSTIWNYDIGTGQGGWGNNEKQYYTSDQENIYVENGSLRITAIKEQTFNREYSSSRIKSNGKADFRYGYLEASIKLPGEGGAWPAFWMMPTHSVYGGWPRSGEIDIMEYVANNQDRYLGTIHCQEYNAGTAKSSGSRVAKNLETEYHKYAIEWSPNYIKFYFDDVNYYEYKNPNRLTDNQKEWPFDQEFYFILNVAVGGTLGGAISSNFTKTSMYVDYVRVYQTDYTNSDNETPGAVNVRSSSTSDSITLNWDKVTDNIGLYHYEIIVNGKQVAATNKLSYTLAGLDKNTDYYIQVLAVDLADNCSSSGELVIKTKE